MIDISVVQAEEARRGRTLFVMEWTGEPECRASVGYGRLPQLYSSAYVTFPGPPNHLNASA